MAIILSFQSLTAFDIHGWKTIFSAYIIAASGGLVN
jgi:hypothetical protein